MKASTPALVALERAGITFVVHTFEHDSHVEHDAHGEPVGFGKAAAQALGVDEDQVFKTLVLHSDKGSLVGIVPVNTALSMKAVANALGAKRCEMLDAHEIMRVTGYVVGGVSPFGQKHLLPTVIDETAVLYDTIFVSGGHRGLDVEVAPNDLITLLKAVTAAIAIS